MNRQLPPLNALRVFESAARLGSFSGAAEALHVTHGAVSRQIRLLEEWLGKALFERRHRQVVLTAEGRSYLAEISPALERIEAATVRQLAQGRRLVLRVNAPATFTLRWLIPRLSEFQAANPQIEINISSSNEEVVELRESFDVVIRGGPKVWKGYHGREFLAEDRLPVCSPRLRVGKPLRKPSDLRRHTLLHTASQPDVWGHWLAAAGVPDLVPQHAVTLEHFYLTLQAALDGVGVAMGPMVLVAEDLASGRLVTPFDGPRLSTWHYFAYVPSALVEQPSIKTFCDWLATVRR